MPSSITSSRVFDTWTYLRVSKEELRLPDERALTVGSAAQIYHYLVDPVRGFAKLNP